MIHIATIRLSEAVESGPRTILLRLAVCRRSAAVEVVRAVFGLNGCSLPSVAAEEMLVAARSARN